MFYKVFTKLNCILFYIRKTLSVNFWTDIMIYILLSLGF